MSPGVKAAIVMLIVGAICGGMTVLQALFGDIVLIVPLAFFCLVIVWFLITMMIEVWDVEDFD